MKGTVAILRMLAPPCMKGARVITLAKFVLLVASAVALEREAGLPAEVALVDVQALKCEGNGLPPKVEIRGKALGSKDIPHAVTFFRTSEKVVTVDYQIADANGKVMLPRRAAKLEAASARRLSGIGKQASLDMPLEHTMQSWPHSSNNGIDEDHIVATSCEEFFLMDGRPPVDLPDTWGEARIAFLTMCEEAVEDGTSGSHSCQEQEHMIFAKHPKSDKMLEMDDALCNRLLRVGMSWVLGEDLEPALLSRMNLPRRLKGGSYSSSRMSSSYPSGYRGTSYGYHGRTPMFAYWYVWGGMGGSRRYGRSSSNASSQGNCDADPAESCQWKLGPNEIMYRDDLTNVSVSLSSYELPFFVTVYSVTGEDFEASRICPPFGWNFDYSVWTPPEQQDLFMTLTPLEHSITGTTIVIWIILGFCVLSVGSLMIWVLCLQMRRKRALMARAYLARRSLDLEASKWRAPTEKMKAVVAKLPEGATSCATDAAVVKPHQQEDNPSFTADTAKPRQQDDKQSCTADTAVVKPRTAACGDGLMQRAASAGCLQACIAPLPVGNRHALASPAASPNKASVVSANEA